MPLTYDHPVKRICYITSMGIGSPWVSLELGVLKQRGIPFELHAMRRPENVFYTSEWTRQLNEDTKPIYPCSIPGFIWSLIRSPFRYRSRFVAALINSLLGEREQVRGRVASLAHFAVACYWADRIGKTGDVVHIHSQWAHSCATIGMYAAWLLGITFSFTGHGADLWRGRVALKDKIRRSLFIACISTFHRQIYLDNGAQPGQLVMVYCGIDPKIFYPKEVMIDPNQPLHIRSSGRLVEKKGYEYLIDACRLLVDEGVCVDCKIVGSGPLTESLRERVRSLGLQDSVHVLGETIPYEEMTAFLHSGDVYCLPCVWAADDDVDGLPAVLFEAMASGLPVVSTRLAGIPDLIRSGENGLLVEPRDAQALATALREIHQNPDQAQAFARNALRTVHESFNLETCVDPLIEQYQAILNQQHESPRRPTSGGSEH